MPPVVAPIDTVPFGLPQVEFADVAANAVGPAEFATITEVVNIQPLASFTDTEYVPAPIV